MTGREFHWLSDGSERVVRVEGDIAHIDDRSLRFALRSDDHLEIDGKLHRFYVHRNRDEVVVWLDGQTYRLRRAQKGQAPEEATSGNSGEVRALMPGKVLRIEVTEGSTVTEKQTVIIMESMKMESALVAPRAGAVVAVKCTVGQVVEMGELLVVIE